MNVILGFVSLVSRRGLMPVLILLAGWYGGAKYGAPDLVINAVDGVIARGGAVIAPLLGRAVEEGGEIAADVVEEGGEIVADKVEGVLEDLAEPPPETNEETDEAVPTEDTSSKSDDDSASADESVDDAPAAPAPAASTPVVAPVVANDGDITLCDISISNAPAVGANGIVRKAGAMVTKNGVSLLLKPATKSCFSSGYGTRNGKLHKGIDYFSDTGGDVLAAGSGVIKERVTRNDFGNMIVVDHGNGVFTRYAHLASFGSGVADGASVSKGQVLGPIGNTGASSIVHLHYEILTGEWASQAGSFGLDAVDPFSLPAGK